MSYDGDVFGRRKEMIIDDIEISKKVFELLNSGIQHAYESFEFKACIRVGYIETKLWVTSGGVRSANAQAKINGAILCSLIEQLKESGLKRGDDWNSFSMSYQSGGEVKLNFHY